MGDDCAAKAEPWRVLMVCTANQCRSPMAEMMLTARLSGQNGAGGPDMARPLRVSSAGIRAVPGCPVTPETAGQLTLRGIDPTAFCSRPLTEDMVREADLVLTASREHRSQVLERVPLALRRTFTLLEFAAIAPTAAGNAGGGDAIDLAGWVRAAAALRGRSQIPEYDVQDPVGGPVVGFAAAAAIIEEATARIAAALSAVR